MDFAEVLQWELLEPVRIVVRLFIIGAGLTLFFRFKGWRFEKPEEELPQAVMLGSIVLGVCLVVAFS